MIHDWARIKTANENEEIYKCFQCGMESVLKYATSMFVGGGECTGIYPIKVRIEV